MCGEVSCLFSYNSPVHHSLVQVTEVILDEHLLVGERFILADGDHYYVGFEGSSLSVEFNTECHYGDVGISDICTCVEMNSEDWAMAHYDAVSFCFVFM